MFNITKGSIKEFKLQCRETFPLENRWSSAEYDYHSGYIDDGYIDDDDDSYIDYDDVGVRPETSFSRRYII